MVASAFQSSLRIEHLSKRYGAVAALDDVSLTVEAGEFLTLLGPSGSGKTTLLMATAGFVEPSAGTISLDGTPILHLPPEKRNFGMVFQGYALFPHLTVARNVAFPLEVRGRDKAAIDAEVKAVLDLVRLGHLAERFPRQLSGGQQQRVALARALVFQPHLLLLDEPLSALDRKLRLDVQLELKTLHRKVGRTFIYVTHDQDEALSMSDRIAIMRDGRIVQQGSPQELYDRPGTRFVADFLGRSNFLMGRTEVCSDDELAYGCGALRFFQSLRQDAPHCAVGRDVTISLRPEAIRLLQPGEAAANMVSGRLSSWSYFGTLFHIVVEAAPLGEIAITMPTGRGLAPPEIGSEVRIGWGPDAGVIVAEDQLSPTAAAEAA